METKPDGGEDGQGRIGALAALHEVAASSSMLSEYPTPTASFEAADYEQLVALAWRHQFDEDRTKFKRELRELQVHVSQRILDRLEMEQ